MRAIATTPSLHHERQWLSDPVPLGSTPHPQSRHCEPQAKQSRATAKDRADPPSIASSASPPRGDGKASARQTADAISTELAAAILLLSSSRFQQTLRRAVAGALVFAVGSILAASHAMAAKLGGAYFVDDAEIGRLGSCEVESWGSFAANTDRIFVFSPACVFNVGRPVELGASYIKIRSDGAWDSTLALTAKTVPIAISGHSMGLAVAGAVLYDLDNHTINGLIGNVPLTWDISQQVRLNVNVGAAYDIDRRQLFATMGAGISWNFVKQWSWISEVFAVLGPDQTNPRFQSGIRYNPTKDIDLDLIYGRNLIGEGANWMTLALTVRINDD